MKRTLRSLVSVSLVFGAQPVLANVTGNDAQNFNPVTGASNYVTVQSSSTLDQGRFSLGLYFSQAANTLPYASGDHQSRHEINDSLTGMDLMIGAGILPRLELGVAMPFVVRQKVDSDDTRGEFADQGNTGVRIVGKWAFLKQSNFGLALVESGTVNRVKDDPAAGATSSPIYNTELAADTQAGRATFGVNVGYRKRSPGEPIEGSLIAPLGDEYIGSVAASYRVTQNASLVTEAYGARPVKAVANETSRSTSSAEALAGVRYNFMPGLVGQAGAGTELMNGYSTPDWRLYAGISTEIGTGGGHAGKTVVHEKKPKKKDPIETVSYTPEDNGPGIDAIPTTEPAETFVLHNINFEFDSDYRVLPGAVSELQKLSDHLAKTGYTKLVIEGHTDFYGTDDYNDNLSVRRARTVRHQLIKYFQVPGDEAIAVGYGKRHPMTKDTSDQGRQLNRRVEIKIYRD